ncbi:hypothetical protein Tco_0563991, partial [Tanacetum coccineum]
MRIRLPLSNSGDFDTNHRTFRPRTSAPFGSKVIHYLSLISPVMLGVDDPLWLHLSRSMNAGVKLQWKHLKTLSNLPESPKKTKTGLWPQIVHEDLQERVYYDRIMAHDVDLQEREEKPASFCYWYYATSGCTYLRTSSLEHPLGYPCKVEEEPNELEFSTSDCYRVLASKKFKGEDIYLTSVYSDGASTVANTLEAKEALNGQITVAASAALGNLNN